METKNHRVARMVDEAFADKGWVFTEAVGEICVHGYWIKDTSNRYTKWYDTTVSTGTIYYTDESTGTTLRPDQMLLRLDRNKA